MKNIILFIAITLLFASPVSAESLTDTAVSLNDNFLQRTQVANVDKIIESNKPVQDFITNRAISGVDFTEGDNEHRICVFCWLFAAVFAAYLYKYGEKIKKKKRIDKKWYEPPAIIGAYIFIGHAIIHSFVASTIFNYYYWMILVDELIFAYFWYYNYILLKKRRVKKLSRRTA